MRRRGLCIISYDKSTQMHGPPRRVMSQRQ
jgi:hypothetical protein